MVLIIPTFSVWLLLANFCFFFAAMAKDLLVLRCCLLGAYTNLFLNSILGLPPHGTYYNPNGPISIDGVACCIVIGFIHLYAIWRLWMDDSDIKLSEELEPVWRLFFRRAGVLKLEFNAMVGGSEIVQFKAGELVASGLDHKVNAYFVVSGVVSCQHEVTGPEMGGTPGSSPTIEKSVGAPIVTVESNCYSGMFCGVCIFSVFGIWLGEEALSLRSTAVTDCRVMIFHCSSLEAQAMRPPLVAAWKNLLLFEMAQSSSIVVDDHIQFFCSSGCREPEAFYHGSKSLDFSEFTADEAALMDARSSCGDDSWPILWFKWVRKTFNPFLGSGLRHANPMPMRGLQLRRQISHDGEDALLVKQHAKVNPKRAASSRSFKITEHEDADMAEQ